MQPSSTGGRVGKQEPESTATRDMVLPGLVQPQRDGAGDAERGDVAGPRAAVGRGNVAIPEQPRQALGPGPPAAQPLSGTLGPAGSGHLVVWQQQVLPFLMNRERGPRHCTDEVRGAFQRHLQGAPAEPLAAVRIVPHGLLLLGGSIAKHRPISQQVQEHAEELARERIFATLFGLRSRPAPAGCHREAGRHLARAFVRQADRGLSHALKMQPEALCQVGLADLRQGPSDEVERPSEHPVVANSHFWLDGLAVRRGIKPRHEAAKLRPLLPVPLEGRGLLSKLPQRFLGTPDVSEQGPWEAVLRGGEGEQREVQCLLGWVGMRSGLQPAVAQDVCAIERQATVRNTDARLEEAALPSQEIIEELPAPSCIAEHFFGRVVRGEPKTILRGASVRTTTIALVELL
mmetsp:Transcript_6327/g.23736  ORF Transcript_6327/g.23736 Transcript_6327/m.23736 type:complete len:403 (-) Transcript_6327:60-1268(-)